MFKRIAVAIVGLALLGGCSNLNRLEQRALSGGAIGAGAGLVVGAVAGTALLPAAAIGAGAGAAIGVLAH